ncbi:hypothetical protein HII13_003435 [Brettanomyces bruxellensis]|nr:hypothetical protein HII13_003435 [Brettanomyces bruxellensis]
MSSFTAINVTDDELDIEEHTRELQIEHALEVFDKALKFQKDRCFESASELYDALFEIEIISSRNDTHNPMIEQLKFMAYRNRGFLKVGELFDELEDDKEDVELKECDDTAGEKVAGGQNAQLLSKMRIMTY